jgi:hypothetical protein
MKDVPLPIVFDNPLVVKHLRSRLRPWPTATWVSVVLVACVGIVWSHQFAFGMFGSGWELQMLLWAQIFLIGIQAGYQISAAVGGARESGIFDYHRISPLPPSWIALGFLLGAPAREWLMFAVTVPFTLLAANQSDIGVLGFLQLEIPLVLSGLILQGVSMLVTLVMRKPKGATQGGAAALLIFAMAFGWPFANLMGMVTGFLYGGTEDESRSLDFFGVPLHWLLFVLLYMGAAMGFTLTAVIRKARSDRAHALSKPLALACLATVAVLVLGCTWQFKGSRYAVLTTLYVLASWAIMLLVPTVTVDRAEYTRGLKRAWAAGRRRPGLWSADASSQWTIYAMAGIVAIAGTISWEVLLGRARGSSSVCVAVAFFSVAMVGLGLQYVKLRLGRYGPSVLAVLLFLSWVVPLILGVTLVSARASEGAYSTVLALSPVAGLSLTCGSDAMFLVERMRTIPGMPEIASADLIRLAAIGPVLSFASVFAFLLVAVQRRFDQAVRNAMKAREDAKIARPHVELATAPEG